MRRTDDVWCSVQMHAIGEVEICVQKFPHLASRPPEYLNRGREEKKKELKQRWIWSKCDQGFENDNL